MKINVKDKSRTYKAKFDTYLDVDKDINFIAAQRIVAWRKMPMRFQKPNKLWLDRQTLHYEEPEWTRV